MVGVVDMQALESLQNLQRKIDALALRERGLVLLGIIAVIYFSLDSFLILPLDLRQKNAQTEIKLKNAELIGLNAQVQQIINDSQTDPNAENKKKLQVLKQEIVRLDEELKKTTDQLVPPRQMTKLLEMVLRQIGGLQLSKVSSLGSSPLIVDENDKPTLAYFLMSSH